MTLDRGSKEKIGTTAAFKGSLARTVVIGLVVLALLPATLVSVATFFRSRGMLAEQTNIQLKAIVNKHSTLLVDLVTGMDSYMDDLVTDLEIRNFFTSKSLADRSDEEVRNLGSELLSNNLQAHANSTGSIIDQVLVANSTGKILFSTDPGWVDLDISKNMGLNTLLGNKGSLATYNPDPLYSSEWVLFDARPYLDANRQPIATIITSTRSTQLKNTLNSAGSLYTSAKAFYVTEDGTLVGVADFYNDNTIIQLPSTNAHVNQIRAMTSSSGEGSGHYTSVEYGAVFGYAKYIPELRSTLVLEINEQEIYQQVNALVPFTLLLFSGTLIIAILVTYLGSRRIIRPLVQLAGHARQFAKGDWTARAEVKSRDEIGLLADSFNHMVEQISDLYRSLELKVEERTRQLRTASEVGQIATSANSRYDMIQRAVHLVVERFGFSFASIFLVDESGSTAVLEEVSSPEGQKNVSRGYRVPVSPDSLIGWTVIYKQARVVDDISTEKIAQNELLLPQSRSEIAIPITAGNQVLGVFEVQSERAQGFENETVSVLQTLANQISNGLQNLRLLEATQINLEETTLLYRTSRQISLTKNPPELFQTLSSTLSQMPYVSAVFSLQEDHLKAISITDPLNPLMTVAPQGMVLPQKNITQMLNQNSVLIIDNLSQAQDLENLLVFFVRRGCKSVAIFPVNEAGKLSMIIVLGSRSLKPLTTTALQPFANLVEVIGITLERFVVLEDLRKRLDELQTLKNLSEVISIETDHNGLFQVLHRQIDQIIGSGISFAVALYDSQQKLIHIPYLYENNALMSVPPFPLGEGLTSILLQNRKPLMMVKNTEAQALALGAKSIGKTAMSWMGVPLIVGGEVVGAIILQDTVNEERFTNSDLNLIMTLAPQIGTAIRNTQLLSQMQETLKAYDQERFLLNSLLNYIPDQVFFKDSEGRFIRVSHSFATKYGYAEPLELVGKTSQDILPEQQADAIKVDEQAILETGSSLNSRIEKQSYFGAEHWLLTSKIAMLDAFGTPAGILGIARDISELKNAEELAQKRARQLQIAAEIARETSSTLTLSETLKKAANLIRDRFGFYHASIFMLDALGQQAVLKEAAGEIGKIMKEKGHKLAIGSQSIVGQATARKEIMVINDVRKEPNYYPNPLLPDTRAELTIPLLVGENVLGAIDVQSIYVDSFNPDEIGVLKILADQLAVAVLNSSLYARTQENLGQHRLLHQITIASASAQNVEDALAITVEALSMSRGGDKVAIYIPNESGQLELRAAAGYEGIDISKLNTTIGEGIIGTAAAERRPVRVIQRDKDSQMIPMNPAICSELAVPILYSDQLVGVLDMESEAPAAYDETDQEIMGSLGNTLGAVIANAQLVLTIRRQVERQRLLYEATSKIRRSVDLNTILKTSTTEICRALGANKAHIEITMNVQDEPGRSGVAKGNGHNEGKENHGDIA
jgi:PAS domain S-box-containing protein